ncbi:WD repeat-containing protein 47-like [Diaphorina citri]|uniref:WD repeat-containing protein 47-like n=1 Tax=Diaphorina citri TaxID=121845 RepID=A0A3Q0JBQ1_DIACI|nr:WD repeat-containing protein 47-like [Diaphorina citri]
MDAAHKGSGRDRLNIIIIPFYVILIHFYLNRMSYVYIVVRVRVRYVMPSAQLSLAEEDVVRLTLEFLHNRGLHISQLSLERETGLVNGAYSDDVLFLRQLILDGQWEDVLEFIQPLGALAAFDMKKFRFYSETTVCMNAMLPNGSGDKKTGGLGAAKNDRLVQLVIKGVLYESCVKYCQIKATGSSESAGSELTFSSLLDNCPGLNESDLSLLSWLQSIPAETFSVPFEQKNLNVDIVRLDKPSLETSWTEHMLITPIKPKTKHNNDITFSIVNPSLLDTNCYIILRHKFIELICIKSETAALTGLTTSTAMDSTVDEMVTLLAEIEKICPTKQDHINLCLLLTLPRLSDHLNFKFGGLPSISELNAKPDQCPPSPPGSSPDHTRGKETSPASSCTTARSSRRDSLSEKNMSAATTVVLSDTLPPSLDPATYDQGDLLKEYQRSKNRMQKSATLESSSSRIMDDSIRSTSSSGNKSISTAASTVTVKSAADPPVHQVPKTNGYNGDTSYEPVKVRHFPRFFCKR